MTPLPAGDGPARVSVICIFYNAMRFFGEAIDSVLAQEFQDFELILVDDGSTDGTSQLALEYCRKFPQAKYLHHPDHQNMGMSTSRNLGIAHSTGEFIAFIDADDAWRPGKLAQQVALMDRLPEVGMICGKLNYWFSWNGGKDQLVQSGCAVNDSATAPDIFLKLYPLGVGVAPIPSDWLARRSLVERVGGFEDRFRSIYEDQAFCVKAYLHTQAYFSSTVWTNYRQHDDSCVTRAHRSGSHALYRTRFLDWMEGYFADQSFSGKERVMRKIRHEKWRMSYPLVARFLRKAEKLAAASAPSRTRSHP